MRFFVGIDWASRAYAVCVIDDDWPSPLAGLHGAHRRGHHRAPRPPAFRAAAPSGSPSSGPRAHRRHARRSRVRRRADPPQRGEVVATALLRRAARPTSATRTCSLTCCAPTAIASVAPRRSPTRPRRCAVWSASATISSASASPSRINSALLDHFWAGAAAIFADVDSPIALDFLDRYPTPQSAARLGEKRMATFLAGTRTAVVAPGRAPRAPARCAAQPRRRARSRGQG